MGYIETFETLTEKGYALRLIVIWDILKQYKY